MRVAGSGSGSLSPYSITAKITAPNLMSYTDRVWLSQPIIDETAIRCPVASRIAAREIPGLLRPQILVDLRPGEIDLSQTTQVVPSTKISVDSIYYGNISTVYATNIAFREA